MLTDIQKHTPTDSPTHVWNLPEPLETAEVEATAGARIILRRHGNPAGPRLVLSHANGLATDLYYPFWRLLGAHFDLILYDLRSHGWNPRSQLRHQNIAVFAADHELVRRGIENAFGAKPAVGVFHLVSALAALHQDPPGHGFEALVLFDPPLYPPSGDPYVARPLWRRLRTQARFRRDHFSTREEFAEHIRRLWMFELVVPGIPELASQTLLRSSANGEGRVGYELRCPRLWEAHALEYAFAYCLEPERSRFACPVKVIAGDPTLAFSFMPSADVEGLAGFEYDFIPHTTHFFPLEEPTECAATLIAFLRKQGFW
ncbi:alpha/beta fold hydrolase [Candidatus Palauibacter sp.]|uniref:alpha/beta fold hydrolase n=1 Tax=Candidatus Palauibacter sp. TaxID=3101350 RepID=UPI003B02962E